MRDLVYHGPRNVSVDQVPDATIEKPADALVRITATNICGSDLHRYYADWNALVLPEDARAKQNDYVMLSDILPTGYHGTELAQAGLGESVVVWGAGPVSLMAAMSAGLRGADQILVADRQPDRLRLAEKTGATAVDDSAGDAEQQILDATRGEGADKGVEAVGYQAHDAHGAETPGLTINSLIQAVRPAGRIGVVGGFVPEDPQAPDDAAKEGKFAFGFGTFFFKGLLHPGLIVSHELSLDQAAEGYQRFDDREDGWTKVVLHP